MDHPTPDRSHDADLIDRIVAWHNRNALTRRITPAQVSGIGVVALPFAAAPPAAGDESPSAAAGPLVGGHIGTALVEIKRRLHGLCGQFRIGRKPAADALFDEDFIAPLQPRLVAKFARRHGELQRPGSADWPQRDIPPAAAEASTARCTRYLRTAAIEVGSTRLRILVGHGAKPAIVGPRLWSRRRLSGLLALLCTTVVAGTLALAWSALSPIDRGEPLALAANATGAPLAARAAAPPVQPASVPLDAPGAVAVQVAATAAAAASAVENSNLAAPAMVEGRTELPAIGQSVALDESVTHSTPQPSVEPEAPSRPRHAKPATMRSSAPPAASTAPAATATSTPSEVFALAAEPTRSRVGSMLRMSLLDLPTEPQPAGAHAELMRTGAQWRVVIWPFADRQSAQRAQGSLASRGVKVKLIAF